MLQKSTFWLRGRAVDFAAIDLNMFSVYFVLDCIDKRSFLLERTKEKLIVRMERRCISFAAMNLIAELFEIARLRLLKA